MSWESIVPDLSLISALKAKGMIEPTEIQRASLPFSLSYRQDVIISSKTGSGKTLCFGIPILQLTQKNSSLQALIISPTRELCIQIESHLSAINYKSLNILTLIGGISHEKQERLLKRSPEILIGTPGRIWEFIKDRQNDYVRTLPDIKFLVIDEADRMIQLGHFKELRLIINFLENPELVPKEEAVIEEHDGVVDLNFAVEEVKAQPKNTKRQTFIISATMTIDKKTRKSFSGKLGRFKDEGEDIMEKLNSIVHFRTKPKLIDLTTSSKLPEGLKEFIVLCSDEEKSSLLHYTLNLFKGQKTIIFGNTISNTRKLVQFLRYLDFKVCKLDGKMQQRDRLKKLEKFNSGYDVLIATDVAARGLDLPEVELIIHYNLPVNFENYIHRSGRTARINKKGTSVAFIGPGDTRSLLEIEKTLGKKIEKLSVDKEKLLKSQEIIKIAKKIAESESFNSSVEKNKSWKDKIAEAAGVDAEEGRAKIGKKKINLMKSQLKKAKIEVEIPRKRATIITPELFELAKKQKII